MVFLNNIFVKYLLIIILIINFSTSTTNSFIKSNNFSLNPKYGKTIESYNGYSNKTVYCILDLHCHKGIQQNIANIIKSLKNHYKSKFNIIGIEGSFNKIDTSIISNIKNKSLKSKMIKYLFENNDLTGPELYSVKNPGNLTLFGIDQKSLYINNFKCLCDSLKNNKTIINSLNKFKSFSRECKNNLCLNNLHITTCKFYFKNLINLNLELNLFYFKKHFSLFDKLLNINISSRNLENWINNRDVFFKSFDYLKSNSSNIETEVNKNLILKFEKNSLNFYKLAIKRNELIFLNTLKLIKQNPSSNVFAIVFGGFHKNGITKLLRAKGISYKIICPNSSKKDINFKSNYNKKLKQQLERINKHPISNTASAYPNKLALMSLYMEGLIDREYIENIKIMLEPKTLPYTIIFTNLINIFQSQTSAMIMFLNNISHDVRNALTSVIADSQSLFSLLSDSNTNFHQILAKTRTLARDIATNSNTTKTTLGSVMDLAEILENKVHLELTNYNIVLELENFFVASLRKALRKRITFQYSIDDRIPSILITDWPKLFAVFQNLIGNAIKFTAANKNHRNLRINATLELLEELEDGNYKIKFTLEDNGIGIDPSKIDSLFDDFERGVSNIIDGKGLGLSICNHYLKLMGSELIAESEGLGHGTTFSFTIILKTPNEIRTPRQIQNYSPGGRLQVSKNKFRILVAEDGRILRMILNRFLLNLGYSVNVTFTTNGQEALDTFIEASVDPQKEPFHLILMDLGMPIMGGFECMEKILDYCRTHKIYPPVIIPTTADVTEKTRQRIKKLKIEERLAKPYSQTELESKINKSFHITLLDRTKVRIKGFDIKVLVVEPNSYRKRSINNYLKFYYGITNVFFTGGVSQIPENINFDIILSCTRDVEKLSRRFIDNPLVEMASLSYTDNMYVNQAGIGINQFFHILSINKTLLDLNLGYIIDYLSQIYTIKDRNHMNKIFEIATYAASVYLNNTRKNITPLDILNLFPDLTKAIHEFLVVKSFEITTLETNTNGLYFMQSRSIILSYKAKLPQITLDKIAREEIIGFENNILLWKAYDHRGNIVDQILLKYETYNIDGFIKVSKFINKIRTALLKLPNILKNLEFINFTIKLSKFLNRKPYNLPSFNKFRPLIKSV